MTCLLDEPFHRSFHRTKSFPNNNEDAPSTHARGVTINQYNGLGPTSGLNSGFVFPSTGETAVQQAPLHQTVTRQQPKRAGKNCETSAGPIRSGTGPVHSIGHGVVDESKNAYERGQQMAVEIQAVYTGSLGCKATHGPSKATVSTDAPLDNGGKGESFSPTDLVATALGTCVLTILGLVSERHDLDLSGATVTVTKEMITQPVRRIGALRTVARVPAEAVSAPSMRERLESAARKCPVHQSLHPDIEAPIDFVYE